MSGNSSVMDSIVIRNYEKLFREADENNDNTLSFEEIKKYLEKYGYTNFNMEKFRQFDTSGDNKISFDEYVASMKSVGMAEHKRACFKKAFQDVDVNHDGFIVKDELKKVLAHLEVNPDEVIKSLDGNKDGKVSEDEFLDYVMAKY